MSCSFSDIPLTLWQFVNVQESHRGANYPASRSVTGALLRACASIVVAGSGLRLTLLPRPGQHSEPGAGSGNVCGTTLAVANAARGLGCRAGSAILAEVGRHSATPLAYQRLTAVGFEPTPLRTGAWSQRLRPLGQTVLTQSLALRSYCCKTEQPHKHLQNWPEEAPQTFKFKYKVAKSDLFLHFCSAVRLRSSAPKTV